MRFSDGSSDVCASDLFNWPPAILTQPVRVNEKTGDIRLGSLHEMRQRVLNSILDFRRNEGKGQRRYFNAFFQQLARFVGGHFSVNLLLALLAIMHGAGAVREVRSEEHTSELQSLMRISYAVFCLKKKKKNKTIATY